MKTVLQLKLICLTLLVLSGCGAKPFALNTVDFSIEADKWIQSRSANIAPISHYGVLVIDVLEKRKVYDKAMISPGRKIDLQLEPAHPYYILLVAYDKENKVLNYIEKEFSI